MEALAVYLLKSVTWISGFAIIFFLFLRNERFFALKRLYLVTGVMVSFILPLVTVRYIVNNDTVADSLLPVSAMFDQSVRNVSTGIVWGKILVIIAWVTGMMICVVKTVFQTGAVMKTIKNSETSFNEPVRLVRPAGVRTSFSFFSYVVVNPSINEIETREIMNHEMIHIRQRHWIDLVLVELLCIIQWFNPVSWIYRGFIRQNHEYLADKGALQQTSDPAIYKATLFNQIVGSQVVSLTNAFNYSLNKKRFNMMKDTNSRPYRKFRLILILPVIALILYAFAEPEYKTALPDKARASGDNAGLTEKIVTGKVVDDNGNPMAGAAVIVRNTTMGTTTDEKGNFRLENVPDNSELIITYVGFEGKVIKAVYASDVIIVMKKAVKGMDTVRISPPPPPPPPPAFEIRADGKGPKPLLIVNGEIYNKDVSSIPPEEIESVTVLKDSKATDKYGEKGKNGVIEIKLKKNPAPGVEKETPAVDEKFVIVEEMPEFPGGEQAMNKWIIENVKYPDEAIKNQVTGVVIVGFTITKTGKVTDVKIRRSVSRILDQEALRVIGKMPDWKPGRQRGTPVNVEYNVPVKFGL